MQNPPPLFTFSEKRATLDWHAIEQIDLDKLISSVDIGKLEILLQNVTFAKIEKNDLKRIKDKNIVKLFKIG